MYFDQRKLKTLLYPEPQDDMQPQAPQIAQMPPIPQMAPMQMPQMNQSPVADLSQMGTQRLMQLLLKRKGAITPNRYEGDGL